MKSLYVLGVGAASLLAAPASSLSPPSVFSVMALSPARLSRAESSKPVLVSSPLLLNSDVSAMLSS